MTTTSPSSANIGSPPYRPPNHGTSPGTLSNRNPTGAEVSIKLSTIKISTPATTDGAVLTSKITSDLFEAFLKKDSTIKIHPGKDSGLTQVIARSNEIPHDASNIPAYMTNLQFDHQHNRNFWFITISSTESYFDIIQDPYVKAWTRAKQVRTWLHTHSSQTVSRIGFVHGHVSRLGSRIALQTKLDPFFKTIEYSLTPATEYVYHNEKKVFVDVTYIEVDRNDVDDAALCAAVAFQDRKLGTLKFIPYIRRGIMEKDPYRNAVYDHYQKCQKYRAVSISGALFGDSNSTKILTNAGESKTIHQVILEDIVDADGKPIFTSIEPTTRSESEGRYLLLTCAPDKIAKDKFDEFLTWLDNKNYQVHFTKIGFKLARTHAAKHKEVSNYASSISTEFAARPPSFSSVVPRGRGTKSTTPTYVSYTPDMNETDNPYPYLNALRGNSTKKARTSPSTTQNNAPNIPGAHAQHISQDNDDDATLTTMNTQSSEFDRKMTALEKQFSDTINNHAKQTEERLNQVSALAEKMNNNMQTALATQQQAQAQNIQLQETLIEEQRATRRQQQLADQRQRTSDERNEVMLGLLLNLFTAMQNDEKPEALDDRTLAAFEAIATDDTRKRSLTDDNEMDTSFEKELDDGFTTVAHKKSATGRN